MHGENLLLRTAHPITRFDRNAHLGYAAGIETFILSGMPLLEEAYRFAELVLPHLGVEAAPASGSTFT